MCVLQRMTYKLFPSAESESRRWVFRCPQCGGETSAHDMGGVRTGATGRPARRVRCRHCGWKGMAIMYQRDMPIDDSVPAAASPQQAPQDLTVTAAHCSLDTDGPPSQPATSADPRSRSQKPHSGCRLWIDGVGCWLLYWGETLAVGGPSSMSDRCRLSMAADLLRTHALIHQSDESYRIEPVGPVTINRQPIDRAMFLKDGDLIGLGADVQWEWRVPSPLAASAVIAFVSDHRPMPRLDGVVLVQQHCLAGPGPGVHIACPEWSRQVVLFVRDGKLWCRADKTLSVAGEPLNAAAPLQHGDVVTGDSWRLRVEVD